MQPRRAGVKSIVPRAADIITAITPGQGSFVPRLGRMCPWPSPPRRRELAFLPPGNCRRSPTGGASDVNNPDGVEVTGPAGPRYDEILTPEALTLIAALQRELGPRRGGQPARPAPCQTRADPSVQGGLPTR